MSEIDNLVEENNRNFNTFVSNLKELDKNFYSKLTTYGSLRYYYDLISSASKDDMVYKKVENAVNLYTKKIQISSSITNELLKNNKLGDLDQRDLYNMSLFYNGPTIYRFKEEEFKKTSNNLSSAFLKYTLDKKNNTNEEKELQLTEVSPFLENLNNFYVEEMPKFLKDKNYQLNFDTMSEEEIFKCICYVACLQTFFVKNEEYPLFAERKYKTYEEQLKYNNAIMLANTISQLIPEQIERYGYEKQFSAVSNQMQTRNDIARDYVYKSIDTLTKFMNDESKIEFTMPKDFFNRTFDDLNPLFDYFQYSVIPFLDSGKVCNKAYHNEWYDLIFIDGVSLIDIAKEQNIEIPTNEMDKKDALSNILRDAIKSADKVIEFAYITDYNDNFVLDTKPLIFKTENPDIDNKYLKTIENAKEKQLERYKSISKNVLNHVNNSEVEINQNNKKVNVKLFEKATSISKNFMDNEITLENVLKGISNVKLYNDEDLNKFVEGVEKEYRIIDQTHDVNLYFTPSQSSLFTNNEVLKNAYNNIIEETNHAYILSDFLCSNPNLKFDKSVERDLTAYYASLKGYPLKERIIKSLMYVDAVTKRNSKENNDIEPSRKIQRELIETMLNRNVVNDFTNESNIYSIYENTNLSIVLSEMIDADKEVVNDLKKENPNKYYKLMDKLHSLDAINQAYNRDVVSSLGYASKFVVPSGIQSLSEGAFDTSSLEVSRNALAFSLVLNNAKFTKANSVDLNFDLSMYGMHETNKNTMANLSNKSIDDMVDMLYKKSSDFGDVMSFEPLNTKPEELALLSCEKMFAEIARSNKSEFNMPFIGYEKIDTEDPTMQESKLIEFYLNSIYVGNKSVYNLASEYLENSNHTSIDPENKEVTPDIKRVAACIFAQALNDPTKNISLVTPSFDSKNCFTLNTVTLKKNYDFIKEQTKDNHSRVSKFLHDKFGKKYKEEKLENKYINTLKNTNTTKLFEEIKTDFKTKYNEVITLREEDNKLALEASRKRIDVKKDIEVKTELQTEVKVVKEVTNSKDIDVSKNK